MTTERRPQLAQRRRRVLYSHQCEDARLQTKGRRAESLREARRPTKAYGSRVYRRLRARWFGIVPVRRRTMMLVASILGAIVLLLVASHAAATAWAPLAYRTEIARPFDLNRPDSFGNWLSTLLLASGSIVGLLIYQLRRHRTNDYRGHYRLWRPAIIILLIASIDSSMRLSDWLGHLVDEALGERRAIAGGDWIRLLLLVGGATFGMRIIAEVRHSKLAALSLASAACMLVFPTLVHWNIIKLETLSGMTLLAAAPLIASALLWIGLVGYLRMLYRDVRNLDAGDRITDHLQHIRQRLRKAIRRSPRPPQSFEPEEQNEKPARKSIASSASIEDDKSEEESDAKPAKRWFGSKASKLSSRVEEKTSEGTDEEETEPRPKRRWFPKLSVRLRPRAIDEDGFDDNDGVTAQDHDKEGSKSSDSEKPDGTDRANGDRKATDEEKYVDPDSIDWNGLSKAERRRLKRQLKRQNRAA